MGTDNGACWHGFSQERGPRTPGPGPPDAAAGRDPGRWRPPARRGHLAPARDPGVTCSRTSPRGGHRALGSSGGRDSPSGAGRRLRAQACSPGEAPAAGSWRPAVFCGSRGPQGQAGQCPPLCLLLAPRLHSAERCRCTEHPTKEQRTAGAPVGSRLAEGQEWRGGLAPSAARGAERVRRAARPRRGAGDKSQQHGHAAAPRFLVEHRSAAHGCHGLRPA